MDRGTGRAQGPEGKGWSEGVGTFKRVLEERRHPTVHLIVFFLNILFLRESQVGRNGDEKIVDTFGEKDPHAARHWSCTLHSRRGSSIQGNTG